jgi:hypothetical protein
LPQTLQQCRWPRSPLANGSAADDFEPRHWPTPLLALMTRPDTPIWPYVRFVLAVSLFLLVPCSCRFSWLDIFLGFSLYFAMILLEFLDYGWGEICVNNLLGLGRNES